MVNTIWLNTTEIRLYFPFFDWFGTNRTSICFQINRCMVTTIWYGFDLPRFGKHFPARAIPLLRRSFCVVATTSVPIATFVVDLGQESDASRHNQGVIKGPFNWVLRFRVTMILLAGFQERFQVAKGHWLPEFLYSWMLQNIMLGFPHCWNEKRFSDY